MLPRSTDDLPHLLGSCSPGNRSCEEVLLKSPARTGDHHWLKVAKTNVGTQQVRAAIARSVQIDVDLVSCAGNRDRAGRCIQWFSVPSDAVDHPGPLRRAGVQGKMQVLELTSSHKPVTPVLVERLRWQVLLKQSAANDGYLTARRLIDRLRLVGMPNYIAPERFGTAGTLAKWGRMLLEGRRLPTQVSGTGVDMARCLRAAQESLFNRYLATRVADGLLGACLVGEVLRGSRQDITVIEDPAHALKRLSSWEAVALGPLYGTGMTPAAGEALIREQQILADAHLDGSRIERLHGERRAIRVQPSKATVDPEGANLRLTCDLPTDTYISVLLAEFLTPEDDQKVIRDGEEDPDASVFGAGEADALGAVEEPEDDPEDQP